MDFKSLNSLPQIRAAGAILHAVETASIPEVMSQFFVTRPPHAIMQLFAIARNAKAAYTMMSATDVIRGDDPESACIQLANYYGYDANPGIKLFMDLFVCLTIYRRRLERGIDRDVASNSIAIYIQALVGVNQQAYVIDNKGKPSLKLHPSITIAIYDAMDDVYESIKKTSEKPATA